MIKTRHSALLVIVAVTALLCSCSTTRNHSHEEDLPVLSQDELIRPYTKLGRIQISREVIGSDYSLSPDIRAWGLAAVRQEAEKLGADAIMLPEISGHTTTTGIIPSTEYRASGIAIKFK